LIIDTHAHIFPESVIKGRQNHLSQDATFRELYSNNNATLATAENLIFEMDESKVDLTIIVGIGWCDPDLAKLCNDYFIDAVRKYPTRLRFLCSANPNWGDRALYEIERCAKNGAIGVGELHPTSQNFDITDEAFMKPFIQAISALNMRLLTHSSEPVGHQYAGKGTTTPELLGAFIKNTPLLNIICAHLGGGLPFYGHMPEMRTQMAKVSFDTAAIPFLYDPSVLQTICETLSPDQILFGSDYPLMSQSRALRYIKQSGIGSEVEAMILGNNAATVYGL
jgi:predicted TIM-barrel fold metal-dependent hydrolase